MQPPHAPKPTIFSMHLHPRTCLTAFSSICARASALTARRVTDSSWDSSSCRCRVELAMRSRSVCAWSMVAGESALHDSMFYIR